MRVKLKDITNYSKGSQVNSDCLIENGKYIYLNGGVNPSGKWNNYNVLSNTVTVSEGGNSSGYINYITEPFWCGAHCYYLFDGPKNTKYLYYALKSQQQRLFKLRSGACMPNIKKKDLGDFELEFDFNEVIQNNIVNILDECNKIIDNYHLELELLDELIKARFVEMFGSIHENRMYPYLNVKNLTTVYSGGTPNRKKTEYWENGTIPWVKTTELQNNHLSIIEECITKEGLENSSAKIIPAKSILIAMYGQGKTRGMTAFLDIASSTNQACACLLSTTNINMEYMWYYFQFSYNKLRGLAEGGNQPNLNLNMIKNFPVLVPPTELQNQFVGFVRQVDKSKFMNEKVICKFLMEGVKIK
ncbi:restriction endonuclease subunit S [Thomasclavelia cocleata]|jgi:type I restriction enzyme S subunit|uniref:restriction endonuclease subunit S n=3 Tax=Thomasclavelia cocleata TaxID=69824 RepID=UPI0024301AA8|nr:restriction endonuclease subunit S [Thomasclavelia cocleata]